MLCFSFWLPALAHCCRLPCISITTYLNCYYLDDWLSRLWRREALNNAEAALICHTYFLCRFTELTNPLDIEVKCSFPE